MNMPIVVKAGTIMVAGSAIIAGVIAVFPVVQASLLREAASAPPAAKKIVTAMARPAETAAVPAAPQPNLGMTRSLAGSVGTSRPSVDAVEADAKRKLDEAMRGADKPATDGLSQISRVMGAPSASSTLGGAVRSPIPAGALAFAGPVAPMRAEAAPVQPAAPAQVAASSAEVSEMCDRARALLREGAVSAARLMLTRAARGGEAEPLHLLAQSYDKAALQEMGVRGVRADAASARKFYALAAAAGSGDASRRLAQLPR